MMDYLPFILAIPPVLIVLYLLDSYWDEAEGLFTLAYLLAILSLVVGFALTEVLHLNFFLP